MLYAYLQPMCYLYSFRKTPEETRNLFNYNEQPNFPPRALVHPASPIPIVRAGHDRQPEFALVRWGFVPSWTKELQKGRPLVNARSETVYEKASFKNAIRRRRCLMPADGFYEWQGDVPGQKQAWYLHRPDNSLFAFGAIWEHWQAPDGSELESAAMLTGLPHMPLAAFHNRSPVVIGPEDFARWLSADEQVTDLLHAPPDDFWTMEKVESPRARKPAAQPPPTTSPQMDLL